MTSSHPQSFKGSIEPAQERSVRSTSPTKASALATGLGALAAGLLIVVGAFQFIAGFGLLLASASVAGFRVFSRFRRQGPTLHRRSRSTSPEPDDGVLP